MMRTRFIVGTLLLTAGMAGVAHADDEDDVRDVYRAYTAALAAGDIEKAKSLVAADGKRMVLIDHRRAAAVAEAGYRTAVEKAFPGAQHPIGYGPATTRPAAGDTPDPMRVAISKGVATITVKDSTETASLRQINGAWKVDLNAMYSPETVEQIEQFRGALTEALNALAVEVAAGRYKTYDDAVSELETRVKMRIANPDAPVTTRPSP